MAVMIVGVLIIVWRLARHRQPVRRPLALCSALLIASAITVSRASGEDMGFTALIGVILPFVVARRHGRRRPATASTQPWWIIFNGAVVMPISFFCLAAGPRYISGPEVAMFYLLETVLAPVWVWLIFSEAPSRNSLIGGTILIVALVAHSCWHCSKAAGAGRDNGQLSGVAILY